MWKQWESRQHPSDRSDRRTTLAAELRLPARLIGRRMFCGDLFRLQNWSSLLPLAGVVGDKAASPHSEENAAGDGMKR
jgi:hypothetical protein